MLPCHPRLPGVIGLKSFHLNPNECWRILPSTLSLMIVMQHRPIWVPKSLCVCIERVFQRSSETKDAVSVRTQWPMWWLQRSKWNAGQSAALSSGSQRAEFGHSITWNKRYCFWSEWGWLSCSSVGCANLNPKKLWASCLLLGFRWDTWLGFVWAVQLLCTRCLLPIRVTVESRMFLGF